MSTAIGLSVMQLRGALLEYQRACTSSDRMAIRRACVALEKAERQYVNCGYGPKPYSLLWNDWVIIGQEALVEAQQARRAGDAK